MKALQWTLSTGISAMVNGLLCLGLAGAMGASQPTEDQEPEPAARVSMTPPPPPPPQPRNPAPDAPSSASAPPASVAPPVETSPVTGSLKGLAVPETDRNLLAWDGTGSLPSFVSSGAMAQSATEVMEVREAELMAPPNLERYYPRRARIDGIEGYSDVLLRIDARGRVQEVTVLQSDPPGVFEGAARAAARQLRLRPAERNGRPQASEKVLRLSWTLPEDR